MPTQARRRFFLGNWKMYVTLQEAGALAAELRASIDPNTAIMDRDVIVAPPLLAIPAVAHKLAGSCIGLAAQNMYWEDKGPYTGEVSAPMLRELGVTHVLIGHSERRDHFNESNEAINRKLKAALRHGLTSILCIGEHASERDAGRVLEVVLGQLQSGLDGIDGDQLDKLVVAYEPVWAIGIGRTAGPQEAELVHGSIRSALADRFGRAVMQRVRIVYGGSVTPINASAFLSASNIDGVLVGAASIKPDSFIQIVETNTANALLESGRRLVK